MEHLREAWRKLAALQVASAPRKRWDEVETGEPATLYLWRASDGAYGGLTAEWQGRLGREFMLGEGTYLAPTPALAEAFGTPQPYEVVVQNPYVIDRLNGSGLSKVDPDAIKRQGYDSIIVRSGQFGFGGGQESLKQIVVFPGRGSVKRIDKIPASTTTLDKGTEVMVPSGALGKITSIQNQFIGVKVKGVSKVQTFTAIQLRWPDGSLVAEFNGPNAPFTMLAPGQKRPAPGDRKFTG